MTSGPNKVIKERLIQRNNHMYSANFIHGVKSMRTALIVAGIVLSVSGASLAQENWNQFRGPNSDNLPSAGNLPVEWSANKNLLWKYDVPGSGWSSPVIRGGKVFVSTAVSDDPSKEQRAYLKDSSNSGSRNSNSENSESAVEISYELYCLSLETGELLWKRVAHKGVPFLPSRSENTHANETPVTDGERVYVYFGMIGLYCFDFDGKLVWQKEMGAYPTESTWGASTSPLLLNDFLFMQIDNEEKSFLAALDTATGNERWRISRDEGTNFSTPIIWKNRVRTELVAGGGKVMGYDPISGKQLWELNAGGGRNINSPVGDSGFLYVGNEGRQNGGGTLFAVKAGASGDITPKEGESTSDGVVWSVPDAGLSMASPLIFNGCVYLVDRRGGFANCYDSVSGEPLYQRVRISGAKAFWATPWGYDGKVFCLDDAGTTFVLKPGSELNALYENSIDDKFWSSPAFADGSIIFRGVKSLYSIGKSGEER